MKNGYEQFFQAARDAKKQTPAKKTPPPSQSFKMSEEKLRSKLNVKPRSKRRNADVPVFALLFAMGAVGLSAWLMIDPSRIENLLDKVEVNFMGAASASAEKESQSEGAKAEKSAAGEPGQTDAKIAKPDSYSEEDINHFAKLNDRKKELDLREKELNELEEELHKQRVEVEGRIQKLEEMRAQIANVLKERVAVDEEKVNKLVEFYSNMKPKQAADILMTINEELAVEVLGRMKKKNAAEVMNLLPSTKAQALSEKFAGYKRK